MAIVNVNSISGINSITAQSSSLNFYTAAGSNLPISAETLNVGTGASVSSPATNVLTLGTNNSERVRINSSGDIGIGTATPSNYFSYDLVVKSRQNTGGVTIAANSTSDTNYLMFADGTSGNAAYRGYINYSHSDDSLNIASAGSVRVTIDSSGNFNLVNTAGIMTAFKYETPALINNHFKSNSTSSNAYVRMYAAAGTGQWDIYGNNANLRFSDNASAGNIQMDRPLVMNSQNIVMSSGNGIDFSATANSSGTMSSELLDDYERGTFTPSFIGSVSNPTVTFLNQLGRYTKIGNVCFIEIRMVTSNVSGGSGNLQISGLPFSQSPGSNLGGAFTKGFVYQWAQDPETFITFTGDSNIYIYRNDSTNTVAQVSDLTSGAANNYLNISGCYITA